MADSRAWAWKVQDESGIPYAQKEKIIATHQKYIGDT